MIYTNFYIQAPVGMLDIPLPLGAFLKPDTADEYFTIPEYLATMNHSVDRFNNDKTMFLKGFGFNIKTLDELRNKLGDYDLVEEDNFFILSHPEALKVLASSEWNELDEGAE